MLALDGWLFANLGRNRLKTLVVILSMALSVVLLSVLCAFVGGFDMEKYLSNQTCADFIVGKTDYFNFQAHGYRIRAVPRDEIAEIKAGTESSVSGMAWSLDDTDSVIWLPESAGLRMTMLWMTMNRPHMQSRRCRRRAGRICRAVICR